MKLLFFLPWKSIMDKVVRKGLTSVGGFLNIVKV